MLVLLAEGELVLGGHAEVAFVGEGVHERLAEHFGLDEQKNTVRLVDSDQVHHDSLGLLGLHIGLLCLLWVRVNGGAPCQTDEPVGAVLGVLEIVRLDLCEVEKVIGAQGRLGIASGPLTHNASEVFEADRGRDPV